MQNILKRQQKFFSQDYTKPYDFRIRQLNRLSKAIKDNEQKILEALKKEAVMK